MKFSSLLVLAALAGSVPAWAGPADYVIDPIVVRGERELDFKFGSQRATDGSLTQGASLGYGYGATDRWFTEVYVKFARSGGDRSKFDAVEWENKFQLTETGRYPVDVGFLAEVEITHAPDDPNELKVGPLFRTEFGRLQLNGNVLLSKTFGTNGNAKPQLSYQWQAKYRWRKEFEFGLQGFGEMGDWDHHASRDERLSQIGPAIFGKLPLGGKQSISYNAAWLLGRTEATPNHTFRLQVEYEF